MERDSVESTGAYQFVKALREGEESLAWEELLSRASELELARGESTAEFLQLNPHLIPQDCIKSYIIFLDARRKSKTGSQVLALVLQYKGGKKVCVRQWILIGVRKWGGNILLPQKI